MRRLFWLALDKAGHALPLLRFGRVRYAICLRADRYYEYTESDEDMTADEFDHRFTLGEPVNLTISPGFRMVIKGSPFVVTEPTQTWGTGGATTWTYQP